MLAVPGFGLTLAFAGPSRLPLLSRLALALPLGFCMIGTISLGLALIDQHRAVTVAAGVLVATAVSWIWGLRRHGARAFVSAWRAEVWRLRWTYLTLFVLLVAFAIIRMTYGPGGQVAPTALRYWADGVEIADAHGIPAQTLHWNTLVAPTVSKVVLNCFHASASLLLGRDPLQAIAILLAVVSVGLFLAVFAVARKLGLRRTAGLVAIFLIGNLAVGGTDLSADLNHYHAESWGRLVVLGGILLAVRAMRSEVRVWRLRDDEDAEAPTAPSRPDRPTPDAIAERTDPRDEQRTAVRAAALAGLMFGVAAGTHLVAFAIGVLFVVAYGIGIAFAEPGVRRPLRIGGTVFACAAVIGLLVLFLPDGDVGFQGAAGREVYASVLADLPLPPDFDPTLYLATGELQQPIHEPVAGFYDPPAEEYGLFVAAMLGLPPSEPASGWWTFAGPVMLLSAASLMVFGQRMLRALALASLLFAVGLLGAGLLFLFRYDLYALAHFGKRRLFDYAVIPCVLLLAGIVELLCERAQRFLGDRRRVVPAVVTCTTFAIAAALFPSAVAHERLSDAVELEGLAWIADNVPCEGRVLADRRTLATFETLTGRAAVLEGMGPHVRPELLRIAVQEMLQAREFFLRPRDHETFLREQGVAAVAVTQNANRLGGWYKVSPEVRPPRTSIGPGVTRGPGISVEFERLLRTPFLSLAYATPSLAVFEVEGFDPATAPGPDVRTLPGYSCD